MMMMMMMMANLFVNDNVRCTKLANAVSIVAIMITHMIIFFQQTLNLFFVLLVVFGMSFLAVESHHPKAPEATEARVCPSV
jgi:ABC-type uncharacterized transport system permease subunit